MGPVRQISSIMLCVSLIFGLCAELPFSARADADSAEIQTIRLFENGVESKQYHSIIEDLRDKRIPLPVFLEFSDGRKFKVNKLLGHGALTLVFGLADNHTQVLRVAQKVLVNQTHEPFLEGFKQLDLRNQSATHQIPIPKIYHAESSPSEFVLVERVEPLFSLKDLAENRAPNRMADQARRDFFEFAKSTWDFQDLNDAHPGNILYVKDRGWMIMDLDGLSIEWNKGSGTYNTNFSRDRAPLLEMGHQIALNERRRIVTSQVLNGEKNRQAILLAADTYASSPRFVPDREKLLKILNHELQHTKLEMDREILSLSIDLGTYHEQTLKRITADPLLERRIRDRLSNMTLSVIPGLNDYADQVKTRFVELSVPRPTPQQRDRAIQERRVDCMNQTLLLILTGGLGAGGAGAAAVR